MTRYRIITTYGGDFRIQKRCFFIWDTIWNCASIEHAKEVIADMKARDKFKPQVVA